MGRGAMHAAGCELGGEAAAWVVGDGVHCEAPGHVVVPCIAQLPLWNDGFDRREQRQQSFTV
jgi:hypothetical protein